MAPRGLVSSGDGEVCLGAIRFDEPAARHERARASAAVRGARDVRVSLRDKEVDPEGRYDHVQGAHRDVVACSPRARALVEDDVTETARQVDPLALRARGGLDRPRYVAH